VTKASVLLTGATRFIGRHVVDELLARGWVVTCLVRPGADTAALQARNIALVEGDLNQPARFGELFKGYDSLVHIPNLASMTEIAALLGAYETAQLRRAVFLSSTGIFTRLPARTKPLRQAAEHAIANSKVNFTVLRPTMVYGGPEDDNIFRLLRFCRRSPVMPIFGSGQAQQQPVHVKDLSWAVAEVLGAGAAQRNFYNLGGGQVLSYNDLVRLSYRALNRRGVLVHLPARPVARAVKTAERLGVALPLREEQILRLEEDKAYDLSAAYNDFGYSPRTFEQGVNEEVGFLSQTPPLR
jgi:uncharacterized protein YbjT (DUF2867 family)